MVENKLMLSTYPSQQRCAQMVKAPPMLSTSVNDWAHNDCASMETLRQRYSGIVDWETIQTAVNAVDVPVVAKTLQMHKAAQRCLELTNASGLMIVVQHRSAMYLLRLKSVLDGWRKKNCQSWNDDDWGELSQLCAFKRRRWCWNRYVTLVENNRLAKQTMQRHAIAFSKGLLVLKSNAHARPFV